MPPKLFISYCWTSPDHIQWVLNLADELLANGVEVIIDKYDLREGGDSVAFMEQIVSDDNVKKVIMICDKGYVEKTNARIGGVGTEAQIISPEMYGKKSQDKFVAVIKQRDAEGNPYVPVYFNGRIYIDLSDPAKYSDNFEQLLRWVFDKPIFVKPSLGSPPAFLSVSEDRISLGTSTLFRRAIEAIRNDRNYADGAVGEYFDLFAENMERFRIAGVMGEPFDETIMKSIEGFTPSRNEAVEMFITLAQYRDTPTIREKLQKFFEQLIPYLHRPSQMNAYSTNDFDNYKFVVHELFLYAIASLMKYERFEAIQYILDALYYVEYRVDFGRTPTVSYGHFYQYLHGLEERKRRLQLRQYSLQGHILKERCVGIGINFQQLIQSDFILYIRGLLHPSFEGSDWYGTTLVYGSENPSGFEVFARARSQKYFDRMKLVLGISDKADLQTLIDKVGAKEIRVPHWGFYGLNIRILSGFDQLATTS